MTSQGLPQIQIWCPPLLTAPCAILRDVPPFPLCPGSCFQARPQKSVPNYSMMNLFIIQTPRRLSARVLPNCISGDARDPSAMSQALQVPDIISSAHGVLSILNPGKRKRVQGCGCSPAPLQLHSVPPSLLDAVLQIPHVPAALGLFLLVFPSIFLCGSEKLSGSDTWLLLMHDFCLQSALLEQC